MTTSHREVTLARRRSWGERMREGGISDPAIATGLCRMGSLIVTISVTQECNNQITPTSLPDAALRGVKAFYIQRQEGEGT